MMMKRLFVVVVAVIFALGIVSLAFAAEPVTGKITKIDGNNLTIKSMGKDVTVEVKSAKDLKVGDEVMVKDGVATKAPAKKVAPGY
jgi:cell division protein FtsL